MTLISQINEAANSLVLTEEKLQYIADSTGLGIEPLNEAVTKFLRNFINKIESDEFKPREGEDPQVFKARKDKVINVFAAIAALTDINTALAFQQDGGKGGPSVEGGTETMPVGSVLKNFYGSNGEEAHKIAQAKLIEIGSQVSPSLRQQAAKMVDSPEQIRAYAQKLQTAIEPVMNKLSSMEDRQAETRMRKQQDAQKQDQMARPMQGMVPQRSGA
jgi:hypothetical protein